MMDYASLAQSGTDLTLGLLNMWFQQEANKEQRSFEQSQAARAYSYDLSMFNAANEYNTPANQMKRLEEAGLNPMLMYGRGDMGNTNVSMPKYQQVKGQSIAPQMPRLNWLGVYQDVAMFKKEMDLKEQIIENAKREAETKEIENITKVFDMLYKHGGNYINVENLKKFADQIGLYEDQRGRVHYTPSWVIDSPRDFPDKERQPSLTDIQMESLKKDVELKEARTSEVWASSAVKKFVGDWWQRKMDYWDKESMNIDRDAYIDRELRRLAGSAGVGGKYISEIIKLISLFR